MPSEHPLGRLWVRLKARLRPAPIHTAEALQTFLRERAAYIAQKSAVDYCRGKTGLASYALFEEETFVRALEICRWESFVAVLGDLFILAEGLLRVHVPPEHQPRLREAFAARYAAILDARPPPPHRAQEGWGAVAQEFSLRLQAASLRAPQPAADLADHSARRMFDTLPIHSSMRELDEEVVYGSVRFRMVAVNQEMQRRVAAAAVASQLIA